MSAVDPLAPLGLNLAGGATEIHLVRHADAVPNEGANASYEAYEAHALSERGRAQASALAEHLAGIGVAAVYASPIRRAAETAQALVQRIGLPLVTDAALREVELGTLDGSMPLRERLDALALVALRDGSWERIPGTEPSRGVRRRMTEALDRIAARHAGARVVVVSHAGAINAYLGEVAGTRHDFLFPLANASVSRVRVARGQRLLMSANETAHLRMGALRR